MLSFREYFQQQMNKTSDAKIKDVKFQKVQVSKEMGFDDYLKQANPTTWTARIIEDKKYLFYNGKFLNVSKFKQDIDSLYQQNGYSSYGYSKLSESELIRYKKVKDLIMPYFYDEFADEVNTEALATLLFNDEYKDFDWQPEEIQK